MELFSVSFLKISSFTTVNNCMFFCFPSSVQLPKKHNEKEEILYQTSSSLGG